MKNLNCPELWIPLKRNSFKKVVTTKLFMYVHFCSLGMKTYRFQVVKSQVTLKEQLLKQNWPGMLLISGHLLIVSVISGLNVPIQL